MGIFSAALYCKNVGLQISEKYIYIKLNQEIDISPENSFVYPNYLIISRPNVYLRCLKISI